MSKLAAIFAPAAASAPVIQPAPKSVVLPKGDPKAERRASKKSTARRRTASGRISTVLGEASQTLG